MVANIPNSETDAQDALLTDGWLLVRQPLPPDITGRLRDDLARLYGKRRAVQEQNGIGAGMEGTCHHLLGENTAMDEFIKLLPLDPMLRFFFSGPYILNSFGGFINTAGRSSGYIGKIHRDVRTFSADFRLMINMLVMLDDFTEENGATYLLPQSQHQCDRPSEDSFLDGAVRALGHAGDILLFDSRLWHAAGRNTTKAPRRALTLTFTRPFFKPQLDYPRFLGSSYAAALAPEVRQVLGFDAQIPSSIEEFYQPPERRAYKADQG